MVVLNMENDLDSAQAVLTAAELVERNLRVEMEDQTRLVKERFELRLSIARKAIFDAKAAVRTAQNAALPDHEWEGRRVTLTRPIYSGTRAWNRVQTGTETLHGGVYTFRHGIDAGPGLNGWHQPSLGEPLVRLAKKDGSLGVKSMVLSRDKWELGQ